jgi:hypothetical protein
VALLVFLDGQVEYHDESGSWKESVESLQAIGAYSNGINWAFEEVGAFVFVFEHGGVPIARLAHIESAVREFWDRVEERLGCSLAMEPLPGFPGKFVWPTRLSGFPCFETQTSRSSPIELSKAALALLRECRTTIGRQGDSNEHP